MSATQIEGLTSWDGAQGSANEGRFALPTGFDKDKFIGKWVKNDHSVHAAKEPEIIRSEGIQAAGWAVWADPKNRKPCIRSVSSGSFILMFRPKTLQAAINRAYGNVSKNRMIQEAEGETLSVAALESGTTQGMLTKKILDANSRSGGQESAFEGRVALNDINAGASEKGEQAEVQLPDFLKPKNK